jgi:phosphopantothenoylcysteine synthetase/decarboxylase
MSPVAGADGTSQILTVILCGAGPASHARQLVAQAQARGWDVHVITTLAGREFTDVPGIEEQTGHRVRSAYRQPGEPRSPGRTTVIVVAPATYNTINKWATGIADNYALGLLAEAPGLGIPVIVLPFVNTALAGRPAYQRSIAQLKAEGVRILDSAGQLRPHPPGAGEPLAETFPWHLALDAAEHSHPGPRGDPV